MKYIIFEDFSGKATPVIFPQRVSFDEMREQIPYTVVLSGGNVTLKQGQLLCSDASNELGIKSADRDAEIIAEHLE